MKRIKIIAMVLTFVMWSGFQAVSAQVTDLDQQNQSQDQTINQDMVSDAWERDWNNMDDKQRKAFTEEWNYSSETDRQQKMQELQQRRQQELNEMTTQERDEYTQNLQARRDKWQTMSDNDREQFGQKVLDYYSGDSVYQYYSRH